MSAPLKERLNVDLAEAVKAKREPDRTVLRSLLAAVRNAEIQRGGELDEAGLTALLAKQLKQREESVSAYATRPELAAAETAEAGVIQVYLPEPLTDAELAQRIDEAIATTGATGPADIGSVMKSLQPKLAGRADAGVAAAQVKAKLA